MKMRKVIVFAAVAALAAGMMSGCGGSGQNKTSGSEVKAAGAEQQSGKKITLKFAHSIPSDSVISKDIETFAEKVNERCDGRLEIQVFADSVMGDDDAVIEQIGRGSYMMNYVDPALLKDYCPDYAIMFAPYLYDDVSEIKELAFSEFGEDLAQKCADAGITVLDNMSGYYGTRQTIATHSVADLSEMKGVKFRVPSTPLQIEMVKAMGASPTTVAFSEVYTALQQGVCDAMENPLSLIYAAKFQEVAKHVAMTSHIIAPDGIIISTDVYKSLDEDLQTILKEEAVSFAEYTTEHVLADEEAIKEKMESEGVEFHEADTEAFKEACQVVYTKFPEWSEGLYDRAKKALGHE